MQGAIFEKERKFGVEFELIAVDPYSAASALSREDILTTVESYNHNTRNYWKITTDSTIRYRNERQTFEIVSPPLSGELGLQQVKVVLRTLNGLGARVNKTCGFHVHWDAQGYSTSKQIKDLLYLYGKFEDVIDGLVAHSRRGNVGEYCHSLKSAMWVGNPELQLEWISRLENSRGRSGNARDLVYQFNGRTLDRTSRRYYKVNITSFITYGTLEFRQHQGTLNFGKVKAWLLFTQAILTRPLRGDVRHSTTYKSSLGELFRALKVANHHTEDSDMRWMREFMKKRYLELKGDTEDEVGPTEDHL